MGTSQRHLSVSLTPHFSQYIRQKVKSGRYTDASDVVRDALRRLEQEEVLQEQAPLLDPPDAPELIQQGIASMKRGDYTELQGNPELRSFFGDIITRGKKRRGVTRKSA